MFDPMLNRELPLKILSTSIETSNPFHAFTRNLHLLCIAPTSISLSTTCMMKRERANEQAESAEPRPAAASFNDQVLRKLQNAIAANPENYLLSLFPKEYSERLAKRKEQEISEYLCLRRVLL